MREYVSAKEENIHKFITHTRNSKTENKSKQRKTDYDHSNHIWTLA